MPYSKHLFSWQQLGPLRLTEALREVLSLLISHLFLLSTVSGLPGANTDKGFEFSKKKKKNLFVLFSHFRGGVDALGITLMGRTLFDDRRRLLSVSRHQAMMGWPEAG